MAEFIANGTTYTKSSKSQTDWTKNCLGVADCEKHTQLADSVTQDELKGFSRGEFLSFMAAAK